VRYTYSRWDGTQAPEELDPDDMLSALADDVLETGDLDVALSRLTRQAVDDAAGPSGARSLVEAFVLERERLRNERRPGREQLSSGSAAEFGHDGFSGSDDWEVAAGSGRPDEYSDRIPGAEPPSHRSHDDLGSDTAQNEVESGPDNHREGVPEAGIQAASAIRARSRFHAGTALSEPDGGIELDSFVGELDAFGDNTPRGGAKGSADHGKVDLDALERELLQAYRSGGITAMSFERLDQILGHGARELLDCLQLVPEALLRAGYLQIEADRYQLTARGLRRMGQKALNDVFRGIESLTSGDHPVVRTGVNGTDPEGHKRYEAESDFLLDLNRTLLNAVERVGPARPIALTVDDFEVVRTERTTRAATVLMLDVSPSMALRGCLRAGRRVALALHALIESRFPRDQLHLVAFSGYARLIRAEAMDGFSAGAREYGTNLHHGLVVARRLLARHRGTRQIVVITDGEPTAHIEGNRVHFAYPPTARTRTETLREVRRCTRDDIVINTFMLDRSEALTAFIDEVTRINRGRAFFTTPDRLGSYVLLDYVKTRRG
jgi:uncharacterized protein with von Willebrand factor type A (vWA) domain